MLLRGEVKAAEINSSRVERESNSTSSRDWVKHSSQRRESGV